MVLEPEYERARKALCFIPADDRETWVTVGMALPGHSVTSVEVFGMIGAANPANTIMPVKKKRGDLFVARAEALVQYFGFVANIVDTQHSTDYSEA